MISRMYTRNTARIRWFIADLDHRPRDLRNRRRSRASTASRDLVLNIVNVPHDVARYGPLIYAAAVEEVDIRLQRATALSTRPAVPQETSRTRPTASRAPSSMRWISALLATLLGGLPLVHGQPSQEEIAPLSQALSSGAPSFQAIAPRVPLSTNDKTVAPLIDLQVYAPSTLR